MRAIITSATCGTLARARRVARYLVQQQHLAWSFPARTQLEYLDVYGESDLAAKETERKSSSCVVIKLGPSVLETSSTTHGVISLSSGEPEMYAANEAGACGIQLQQFLTEVVFPLPLRLSLDSAAPRGMMTRRGSGRVKHLDITALWCEQPSRRIASD